MQQSAAHLWKALLLRDGLRDGSGSNLPLAATPPLAQALLLSFLTLFGGSMHLRNQDRAHANLLVQQAKLYIRDNLSQSLGLKDVAHYLNVSERHLSRLFAAGIHESFSDFIRGERIRQATHLLLHSGLSIKEKLPS